MEGVETINDWWPSLLDSLEEEISLHSADGKILYANRSLCEACGKPSAELVGIHFDKVFPDIACAVTEAMATGSVVRGEDGGGDSAKTGRALIIPLAGGVLGGRGFARIGRRAAEKPTQDALLKAEHFATLGQMISGIAHDVGTPLNIISGYAEYLLMRTKAEELGRKELTAILEQTRRVAEYIRIMLDLARPSKGRVDAIELKGFLGDSLELMGSHLRKANVRAELISNSAPPVIYGDGPRLRQAFFNLLINAGRRVGAGGRLELFIEHSLETPEFIAVRLKGIDRNGCCQDYSDSFSSFLSPYRRWGAEDMGLALTKEIFDEYGAKVTASPIAGGGADLVIYLPKKNRWSDVDKSAEMLGGT